MTFWHTPSESYKFQPSKINGMNPPINQTILAFSSTWGIEMSKRLDIHKKSDSPNGAHESTVTGTGLDCNVLMKTLTWSTTRFEHCPGSGLMRRSMIRGKFPPFGGRLQTGALKRRKI